MLEQPIKRGPADMNKINIHEEVELAYWSKHFGVPKSKIIEAVNKAGTAVMEVKKWLRK